MGIAAFQSGSFQDSFQTQVLILPGGGVRIILVDSSATAQTAQLVGTNRRFEVDVSSVAVEAWRANAWFASSALVRPSNSARTGFVYQANALGETGRAEPAWAVTAGQTVIDGSITWTTFVPPAPGEDTIVSATWAAVSPPDGTLAISGQSNSSLVSSAYIGGGTAGNVYMVLATITMSSGAVYPVQIFVTIL